jgi:simple sugar transport system permease protein
MKTTWNRQQLSLFATIFIAVLLFISAAWRYVGFASTGVMVNLVDDNAFLGIAAVGMTFVILSGGIDLSVGSIVGLTSILSAILIQKFQLSPVLVIPLVIFLGAGFGALMGLLIALFNLAPFLVTLAGMFFARGLAYTLSLDSIPVNHPVFAAVSQTRLNLGFVSLPAMAVVLLVVVGAGIFVSTQTQFGRAVYALGGNQLSARLMGLRVERYQIGVYALSGMTAALAGVVYTFYTSAGNATAAMGLELDAIAAVVIGGTLLSGGSGTVFGTLLGTLILGMIQTIITFESTLSSWWTKIVIGALLFFFVVLQKGVTRWSQSTVQSSTSGPQNQKRSVKETVKHSTTAGILFLLLGFIAFPQDVRADVPKESEAVCPPGQHPGAKIVDGLYQLTGTHLKVGQTVHTIPELPDPAPPYVTLDGAVEIYGSAQYFIRYKDWDEFDRGGCFEIVPMSIVGSTGLPYREIYTHPWDLRKFRIESKSKAPFEVLLGGAMSPSQGRATPTWPEDNLNRRIYFFRINDLREWVRDVLAVVGTISTGWLGHSYGGNLLQVDAPAANVIQTDAAGEMAFFYEKVSEVKDNGPFKTEMFAVHMDSFDHAEPSSEVKIFDLGANPYPSTERVGNSALIERSILSKSVGPFRERIGNGYLVEGPRPFQIRLNGRRIFIVGFSSGDFPTNSYHLNFMWSSQLMGPYKPLLTEDKKDLKDFGEEIKRHYGLSWVGRPSLYQTPKGDYQMLFHGVVKSILPDNDYSHWPEAYQLWEFFRCLFKVDVQITEGVSGDPVVQVLGL